jgi:hypothetical protein
MTQVEIVDSNRGARRASASQLHDAALLQRIRSLANLLDNCLQIPGTSYRIGWDGLIGLIPGIGDLATASLAAYLIYLASQLNVPRSLLNRMILNVVVDLAAGAIPIVGDVADIAWKANLKNVRLLERHLLNRSADAHP